jgi:hypothetical protein
MNHVQILHAGVVQNLHSPGRQKLHEGGLARRAEIALSPGVEFCMQEARLECKKCRLALRQYLHAGRVMSDLNLLSCLSAKKAFRISINVIQNK